jgi:hypothetical protein
MGESLFGLTARSAIIGKFVASREQPQVKTRTENGSRASSRLPERERVEQLSGVRQGSDQLPSVGCRAPIVAANVDPERDLPMMVLFTRHTDPYPGDVPLLDEEAAPPIVPAALPPRSAFGRFGGPWNVREVDSQ